MTKITMKRGDTFAVFCQRVDASGNPVNLTGVTISATIALLTFTGALTVTVTDAVNGKFTVSATPAATSLWPVTGSQQMFFDVQFDDGTYVVSSDSIQVVVQQSQTQVASTSTGLPGQSGNPLVFRDAPNATGNIAAGANVQTGSVIYQFAASYMGALAADPATRTDGSALQTGDIYWNTASGEQRTFNGANWQVVYTPSPTTTGNINYTGTLTGGTGVINIGAGQLYKDAAGNIGIGIVPGAWGSGVNLEIGGNGRVAFRNSADIVTNAYFNGTSWIYDASSQASNYTQIFGEHRWYNAPSGTAGASVSFTQAMTLDANGRNLIGKTTASGASLLQVNSAIQTAGYTVSTLPAGSAGDRAYVTDAVSPTFLGALTGGGSVATPVFHNGAAWVAA